MVSIVIPTRNEEGNIRRLLVALKEIAMLYDCHFEYIIVDDSDDDTGLIAYSLGARVIKGQGKGLGQAMLDGLHMSYGDIVVFMDADLSHDPQYIPSLLKPILDYGYDMTIGSRYVADGGSAGWGKTRSLMSRIAGMIGYPITGIRDSSSGFFAIKRGIAISAFPSYEPSSWKIMLEILVKANPIAVCEIPIIFKERNAGKSKYNTKEGIKYLAHLGKLLMYKLSHSHIKQDCNEADYEWRSYFKANPLRRKWKSKI